MKNVVIDTGFWFALFDPSDEHHKHALDIYELITQVDRPKYLSGFNKL